MSLFPFSREGRQTLVYLVFAGAGPVLTGLVIWAMLEALLRPQMWALFGQLALIVAAAMMVIVIGLSMFVSIRAIKVGKDGIEASGEGGDNS